MGVGEPWGDIADMRLNVRTGGNGDCPQQDVARVTTGQGPVLGEEGVDLYVRTGHRGISYEGLTRFFYGAGEFGVGEALFMVIGPCRGQREEGRTFRLEKPLRGNTPSTCAHFNKGRRP